MPEGLIKKSALISPCGNYRYWLKRTWDLSREPLCVVGINPSTADDKEDDNTVRRCVRFARDWGHGGVILINPFAYRSRDIGVMLAQRDPVGPENDRPPGAPSPGGWAAGGTASTASPR
jgi:hypothetical protein